MAQTDNRYMLILARNTIHVKILTWQFPSKEEAILAMQEQLQTRLSMDLPDETENLMALLKDGVELSNAAMTENSAHIYQDYGKTYHFWKIVEIS